MQSYREVKAINNSLMGTYEDDYQQFVGHWVYNNPLTKKSDNSLTMGSVVDVLLTRPEDFDNEFIIFKGKVPTAQMGKFCEAMATLLKEQDVPESVLYQQAYDAVEISGFKLETIVKKYEAFKPYVDFLLEGEKKQVLSTEQEAKAKKIVEELRVNTFTSPIVNATTGEGREVYNQLEVYGTYDGIPTKGAIDRVLVSHHKKIVQPIDFKTSYNVLQFANSYHKYRYYRQGSYYSYLLRDWMEEKGIGDYKILPFMFVVCSTSGGQHFMYRMTQNDLEAAEHGGETKIGEPIKGWRTILDEIVYMTKKGDWAFPYEALVNNGIIELNMFK